MKKVETTYLHCSLCGFEFEKGAVTCAHGCPLGRFCKLIRCPNCGFEFPASSSPLTWFQKLFHRQSPPPSAPDLIRLDQLTEGDCGQIACITSPLLSRRNTLALYGLAPGGELVLEQKWPTFILRVGETELAIEAEIAREIFLKAKPPCS